LQPGEEVEYSKIDLSGRPKVLAELHPDVLRDHRPERFANVLQESRVLSDESPTDFGGEVDVAFLLDQAEHLRAVENVEQFLELVVGQLAEAFMDREVLP